jgi:uncharacterized protein YkwD
MTGRIRQATIHHEGPRSRRLALGIAVAAALLLLALSVSIDAARAQVAETTTARPAAPSAMEAGIIDRINAARRGRGLKPLRLANGLERAAGSHARTLAAEGVFAHEVDGVAPATRIRRFYRGSTVAEVLQWRSPTLTPEQALAAWLASPTHRSIILSGRFSDIGLAALSVQHAPGYYGGRPVTIVVADLGAR